MARTFEDVAVYELLLLGAVREVLLQHLHRGEVDGLLAFRLGLCGDCSGRLG